MIGREKQYCGDCIYYTWEDCKATDREGSSREGQEVNSITPTCDCYEENNDPIREIFPGTMDALRKLRMPN